MLVPQQTLCPDDYPVLVYYPDNGWTCVVARPSQLEGKQFIVLSTNAEEPNYEQECYE